MATSRRRPAKKAGYHHGDLRRALIDAALEVIERDGPAALTLRDLAPKLGVTHAAPYRHFRDKHSLLSAVAEEGFRHLRDAMLAACDEAGPDPEARLLATGVAYVRFATSHRGHFAVMFSHVSAPPPDVPDLPREAAGAFAVLLDAVVAAQRAEMLRRGDPLQLARACWAMVHGLATLLVERCLDPVGLAGKPEVLAADAVEDLLLGLAPR